MKWLVYNVLFLFTFPFLLPGFLLRMLRRGGYAAHMGDRFALYGANRFKPAVTGERDYVWVHAVSVGEVQVAGQLMREWRKVEPSVRFCFSTTSSTGWKMAEREIGPQDVLIYNPLDFPSYVKSALGTVRPRALILTESEIWPNFIRKAAARHIPIFLINARVSDRSAPRYRLARLFFRDVFACFTRIFAQSELDQARLVDAGAPREKVVVTGSFKFDVARRNVAKESEMRAWIGEGRVLLGGSTWPGEDEVLLSIAKSLGPTVKLVLAPRHFEKADAVEANIRKAGFACVRRSRGETGEGVYLADTTGELMGLYGIADVVFVGKSLCAHGSQNMIEPCLCGKPTIVGPYTENFRPVMSDLLESRAIVQVRDAEELERELVKLLADDEGLGSRAAVAVQKRQGVVAWCVAAIRGALCLACVAYLAGCSRTEEQKLPPHETCAVVEDAIDLILRLENPDAENDLIVKRLNVEGMDAATFRRELEACGGAEVHVWMPGEADWLLVGHPTTNRVSLAQIMDAFSADVKAPNVAPVFASYVGTRDDILPAFAATLKGFVVPEWFVTREIPELTWLDTTDVEADILPKVQADMRSVQVVRRLVLEGNMLAAEAHDKASEEKAIDCWTRANMRNPHDPMIRERMEKLSRNARGFLEVNKILQALKCYETMVLIDPKNAAAVHNFGMCLKRIGKLDMAEQVLKRAEELSR